MFGQVPAALWNIKCWVHCETELFEELLCFEVVFLLDVDFTNWLVHKYT